MRLYNSQAGIEAACFLKFKDAARSSSLYTPRNCCERNPKSSMSPFRLPHSRRSDLVTFICRPKRQISCDFLFIMNKQYKSEWRSCLEKARTSAREKTDAPTWNLPWLHFLVQPLADRPRFMQRRVYADEGHKNIPTKMSAQLFSS